MTGLQKLMILLMILKRHVSKVFLTLPISIPDKEKKLP